MHIAVDATPLLLRSAGVKTYLYHWTRALRSAAQGTEHRIDPFPLLENWMDIDAPLEHDRSVLSPAATWLRLGLVQAANVSGVVSPLLGGADLFHASNMVRAIPKRARLSATIHDLTTFLMPELHTEGNIRADREYADRVLKRADRIIAVSENTKRDAMRVLGISQERIEAIHPGVADEYFDAKPTRRAKPYALFVGTIEPRKNVATLLDAWKLLRSNLREAYDLVIAGPAGWRQPEVVERVKRESVYLGYVPERDMPGLFAGASLLVYPSLYEGFGLPVAQAMAASVPVVTSNVSCLPEVAGDGALLVDPRSAEDIATKVESLLESEDRRARAAIQSRAFAERYRWSNSGSRSLAYLTT